MIQQLNPYILSSLVHLVFAFVLLAFWNVGKFAPPEPIPIQVYENPKVAKKAAELAPIRLQPKKPEPAPVETAEEEGRKVFGISKNTLTESKETSEADSKNAVEVKAGNTVAIAPDDLELKPGDADSIPIPTEEYLVTQMPVLREEIRIPYPEEAKEAGVEGPVLMDLLVDQEGAVREVRLIEGPGSGLNEAALEAVKRLRFEPARVEEKTVAVRIRYIYRFVLERS